MHDTFLDKKDYTYLKWSSIRSSSGTAGSFLKATETVKGKKIYYKLSNYNSVEGIIGHECVNEIIASRLMNILDVEHLKYRLLYGTVMVDGNVYDTYFCASDSFRQSGERKMTLEDYYQLTKRENETPMEFVRRNGWGEMINQMFVIDYLILNRDRHGANIELIRAADGSVRMAPLFDQGISLLFQCHDDYELESVDVMADKPIQSFPGTNSAEDNLQFVRGKVFRSRLEESDKKYLFEGLGGIINSKHIDKIWEMIWERWKHYESMFNI